MKTLCLVFTLSLSLTAAAGVKEEVATLGKLAFGFKVHSVKAKTAEAIVTKWMNEYLDAEPTYKEFADMTNGDETSTGMTSLKSAVAMGQYPQSYVLEMVEQSEDPQDKELYAKIANLKKNWAGQVQKLNRLGAKFGYRGDGPGYCGVGFIELLVIDEKEQKLYEVLLSKDLDC